MKFCKNCKWYQARGECGHRSAHHVSPVTGENLRYSAMTMRGGFVKGDCGKEAVHFEPKLTRAA